MSSFIHCNSCGISVSKAALVLLSCKHVCCNSCFLQSPKMCLVCKLRDCKAVPINNNMAPSIKQIFSNPNTKLREMIAADSFQLSQKLRLLEMNEKRYNEMKQQLAEIEAKIQMEDEGYRKEIEMIKKLRAEIAKKRQGASTSLPNLNDHSKISTNSFRSLPAGEVKASSSFGSNQMAQPQPMSQGNAPFMNQHSRSPSSSLLRRSTGSSLVNQAQPHTSKGFGDHSGQSQNEPSVVTGPYKRDTPGIYNRPNVSGGQNIQQRVHPSIGNRSIFSQQVKR